MRSSPKSPAMCSIDSARNDDPPLALLTRREPLGIPEGNRHPDRGVSCNMALRPESHTTGDIDRYLLVSSVSPFLR